MAKKKTTKIFDLNETLETTIIDEITNISIKGAREHNLKNINLSIPREKFVVITGLSGSGKSSLAFDTLYADGQRRYVECLSSYAKQFMGMLKKPEVDSIEGLSPAISIEQKSISHSPRSTVGTVTEIYDYLRLLFSKLGTQYSLEHNVPVVKRTLDEIIQEIITKYSGRRIIILSPIIKGRKGHYRELFEQFIKQGFTKVRIDGEINEIQSGMQLSRYKIHDIELVIDRLLANSSQEHRIIESCELALSRGDETMMLLVENAIGKWEEKYYNTSYSCPLSGVAYRPLAPNMFSFNSPYGACSTCEGLGEIRDFDIRLMTPDDSISIQDGGITPIGKKRDTWLWAQVESYAKKIGLPIDQPINTLDKELLNHILFGGKDGKIEIEYGFSGGAKAVYQQTFNGIVPTLKHHYENTSSGSISKNYENFMASHICEDCQGGRLKKESLYVRIRDKSISDITSMDINQAIGFFDSFKDDLSPIEKIIGEVLIKEILSRLKFLTNVGLSYLNLNRAVKTLSGGEAQRIRLASQIGSELVGILYVLDEPSIGLHQHDNNKLINSLKKLRDLGNTVIVVEHDKAMIEQSDYFIDMGPGAGIHGGEIVIQSEPGRILEHRNNGLSKSLTAQYISGERRIPIPQNRRQGNGQFLSLQSASGNNLKNVNLNLPIGKFTCITGMSGSGKSSLINDTLYPILSKHFYNSIRIPLPYSKISGLEYIDKVIEIDQTPIGRTPRSNPATYTGVFTLIRDFYSLMPDAKIRGYKSGRFSFNVKGGRCEECEGAGIKKIEMNFLPDVYVTCDVCEGKRYNKETLEVKFKGKSISDVLALTVEESLELFRDIPKIYKKLKALFDVGLTYITLGQQAPTLSGGEAQRVKLATELSKVSTGKTLYLLDEPTTGLHFEDISVLLKLLDKLVDKGNTVVVIEHNLDVVKYADWVIDLGPDGGDGGGFIIAEGTPEDVVKINAGYTARYLKEELNR